MKAYVGITDYEWYQLLASRPQLEELNFWQPGGSRIFRALQPGEFFLFKLHAPRHSVVGGGFFAHATRLPVSLAWEAFGEANGATSLMEMRARIERYRKAPAQPHEDYTVGCILLEQPFFFPEEVLDSRASGLASKHRSGEDLRPPRGTGADAMAPGRRRHPRARCGSGVARGVARA